jgi:hypothetical protein
MIISAVAPSWNTQGPSDSSAQNDALLPLTTRQDVVSFSETARNLAAAQTAISHPAAMLSNEQVQVKMSLMRDFMDILFGRQEEDATTTEEEITAAVLEKPVNEQAMQVLQQNGWIA